MHTWLINHLRLYQDSSQVNDRNMAIPKLDDLFRERDFIEEQRWRIEREQKGREEIVQIRNAADKYLDALNEAMKTAELYCNLLDDIEKSRAQQADEISDAVERGDMSQSDLFQQESDEISKIVEECNRKQNECNMKIRSPYISIRGHQGKMLSQEEVQKLLDISNPVPVPLVYTSDIGTNNVRGWQIMTTSSPDG